VISFWCAQTCFGVCSSAAACHVLRCTTLSNPFERRIQADDSASELLKWLLLEHLPDMLVGDAVWDRPGDAVTSRMREEDYTAVVLTPLKLPLIIRYLPTVNFMLLHTPVNAVILLLEF